MSFVTLQGKAECYKVFYHRIPPYLDELLEIFQNLTVDGSSAFCPGFEQAANAGNKGTGLATDPFDLDGREDDCSPMSTSTKRPSSTATTGESPIKRIKSPMVRALRGLVAEIKIDREEGKKKEDNYAKREEARSRALVSAKEQIMEKKQMKLQAEMDECVNLAKECGIAEDSTEMFVASELFMDAAKRAFFRSIKIPESRYGWIKWHYAQRTGGLL
jgi:hypothetical protein